MKKNKKVLLNISGHPLSDEAREQAEDGGYAIINIPVPNVDVTSSESILEYLEEVFKTLSKNKSVLNAIRTNNYGVIPAGMSILTSCIIAMLHGISGGFPTQLWLTRNDDGKFVFGDDFATQLDLQEIRLKYRDFRQP